MKEILFPVARLVGGSLYKVETKVNEKTKEERQAYSFAIAIAKGAETHWNQTAWGALIWAEGAEGAPSMHQNPAFAWKVKDGDSAIPNRKGNKPCDNEGWRGHWVLWMSSGFAPKIVTADGSQAILEVDAVKPGYFVQVFGNVAFNKSTDSPGVYLNFAAVAFSAYGPEIQLSAGVDTTAVGFGKGPLPAGAMSTPAAGMSVPPATIPTPPTPAAPGVAPYSGYTAPPAPPAAPAAPVAWPPAGWTQHPQSPTHWYKGTEVLTEAELRALVGA